MAALLSALALLALAWLLHLAWWRIRVPRRQLMALLGVFIAVAAVAGLACMAFGLPAFLARAETAAILALYVGAASCYLIIYTGIEQTSPSLVIVRALESARVQGCSGEELASLITDDQFLRPRLEALALDGLLVAGPDGWALTEQGRRAARVASAIAQFFHIEGNS